MKRAVTMLASAVGGYLAGAVAGYFFVTSLSANTHDRSVEAAMTAAFVAGPAGALVAIVAVVALTRR